MLSEKWWSYSISKIHLILKIQENQQELARTVKRESRRESGHSRFLYWFTQQPGDVQSPTHSKDFTKLINLIRFTTLAYSKKTLHSAANHCWTYSRPRNTTESTVRFKNSLAQTHSKSQLYRIHCITQTRLTAPRSRPLLNPQQNRKPHRNPLCVSRRPLLNPTASHTLYRAHCTEQNYQPR